MLWTWLAVYVAVTLCESTPPTCSTAMYFGLRPAEIAAGSPVLASKTFAGAGVCAAELRGGGDVGRIHAPQLVVSGKWQMKVDVPAGDDHLERDLHVLLAHRVGGVAVGRQSQRRLRRDQREAAEADGSLRELQARADRLEIRHRRAALAKGLRRIFRLQPSAAGQQRERHSARTERRQPGLHLTSISPASGLFVTRRTQSGRSSAARRISRIGRS